MRDPSLKVSMRISDACLPPSGVEQTAPDVPRQYDAPTALRLPFSKGSRVVTTPQSGAWTRLESSLEFRGREGVGRVSSLRKCREGRVPLN